MDKIFTNKFSVLKVSLATIFVSVFLLISAISASAEMISIKGDKVNLRKGPGTKYSIVWEYGDGYPLTILSKKGNWYEVKDFENDSGWIHKSLTQYSPHVIVKVNRNSEEKINIRKEPGTKSDIVGKAQYGVVFQTLQRKSGWVNIKHDSGLTGWIKESLLWGY
ncbi:SH3 domain-containing protein [Desulforhopalus sp. IMCC35007]|uniref:SH3 domain-containing protein n=1 Tax=Desulforhopalus sp. IMCC35007 TaxID=2569543 RepID=UPI0010AEDDD9|nr:SH3 domain-containing protein [Desulforhopalus sp. IMCC35007]TKB11637.1 peptide-binding protein [Desulforhopalus sp. IMCC35007]